MTTSPTLNVASHLACMAEQHAEQAAVIMPVGREGDGSTRYETLRYDALWQESLTLARGLRAIGVEPGTRVVLMVPPSREFFALVFAIFSAGAVLVAVDPGIGLKHLKQCLGEAEPTVFIGIRKARLARWLFGWAGSSLRRIIAVEGSRCKAATARKTNLASLRALGQQRDDAPHFAVAADEMAAILFTSGSTGVPKGVEYSHANFDTQVRRLREVFAIEPGEVDCCTFPLFALYAPAFGMTAVVPEMDFTRPGTVDPERIREPLTRWRCTNLFGSPALLNRVGRAAAAQGWSFPQLKRVLSAGAPVPPAVLRTWTGILADGVQVFTPYGATESLPVAVYGSADILAETAAATEAGKGTCVGPPVAELEAAVIAISDDPIATWSDELRLADGQIGEICVRGPQVTRAYFRRPEQTALAKIASDDGGFWHRMGDLGYRDDQGRLWFCGRKSHRVRSEQGEFYTIPLEGPCNAHPQVFRTALVGVGAAPRQRPVLIVECEPGTPASDQPAIQMALEDRCRELGCELAALLFHPSLPVDIRHNAKIDRPALAVWAAGRIGP